MRLSVIIGEPSCRVRRASVVPRTTTRQTSKIQGISTGNDGKAAADGAGARGNFGGCEKKP
jgi:hypothetical protein